MHLTAKREIHSIQPHHHQQRPPRSTPEEQTMKRKMETAADGPDRNRDADTRRRGMMIRMKTPNTLSPAKPYRLQNCFVVARPCPPQGPMSSAPAVAASAAQVPLRHAREVYRCTLFGTSQAWDIPDALRGLRRSSGAFRAWYMVQFRLTRKSLAARGNIQACKSIKETKDRNRLRSRLYMKRCRDRQRVVAQRIALGRNAAPWLEGGGEIVD